MNDNNNEKNQNINNPEINETDFLMKQLDQLSFTEDKSFEDPISFKKNTTNNHGSSDLLENFYLNMQQQKLNNKDMSKITFNSIDNTEYNGKKDFLKIKLDNILTSLRLSDIKLNIKYYGALLKFDEYIKDDKLINNCYDQFDDLFNIIIELIYLIKKEYEKNKEYMKNNKNNIILRLEKELNNKDNQIKDLINKLKIEKQKALKNSNITSEIAMLKKENNELLYQINVYKNQIKKIDSNNIILEEKLRSLITEKLNKRSSSVCKKSLPLTHNKTINMNTNININNYTSTPEYSTSTPATKSTNTNESNNNSNTNNNNNNDINIDNNNNNKDMNQNIKNINLNLINLLKEINKLLGEYETNLNKMSEKSQNEIIAKFNSMNILKDYDRIDDFYKLFLGNRDKLLVKIVRLIDNNENKQMRKTKDYNIGYNPKYYSNNKNDKKKDNKEDNNSLYKTGDKSDIKILVNKKNLFNKK